MILLLPNIVSRLRATAIVGLCALMCASCGGDAFGGGSGGRAGTGTGGSAGRGGDAGVGGSAGIGGTGNPPQALGFENFENVEIGASTSHRSGHEWASGPSTSVVDIAAEGLPSHGGGGSKVLRSDWRQSECQNENLVRLVRLNDPPAPDEPGVEAVKPIPVGDGDELWVRLRLFFAVGFGLGGGQGLDVCTNEGPISSVKFIRPHFLNASMAPSYSIRDGGIDITAPGNERWHMAEVPNRSSAGPDVPRGEWITYEMYQRYSVSDPKPGDVKIWFNNQRIFTSQSSIGLHDSPGTMSRVEIFEYWNSGVPSDRVHYVDDLVMTKAPQNADAKGFDFIGGAL